jgi:hypothetical protein
MCLYVKKNHDVETNIRPRLVWKWVSDLDKDDPRFKENWKSICKGSYHRYDEELRATILCEMSTGYKVIEHLIIDKTIGWDKTESRIVRGGFHSFRNPFTALFSFIYKYSPRLPEEHMVPCIIPAGTEIVKGENCEIVSRDIIVFRDLRSALKKLKQLRKRY